MLYSLVDTLTELNGIDSVRFMSEGELLEEYSYIRLDKPLVRAVEFTYPNMAEWDWYVVWLYLETADGRLTAVPVPSDNQEYPNAVNMTGRAVELLLSLDAYWGYAPAVPRGTQLLGVEEEDRICTLTVSRQFLSADPQRRDLAAEALAATAIDAGGFQGVRIRVENTLFENGKVFRKEGDRIVEG